MKSTHVQLLFPLLLALASLTRAHIVFFDEYWQRRAAEAHNNTLKAYVPDPESVVNHFNSLPGNTTKRSFQNEHTNILKSYVSDPEFISDYLNFSIGNSTRRNLRSKRRYFEPCDATNPIDRCWRCKKDWARDRKRLARCARGFGRDTIGGLKGKFYVVTDASDDSLLNPRPGTLRYAVTRDAPLWIIFARDMVIKLQQELIINSYKTIDARGANVHIAYGAGLTIQFVQHVIVHNLHIHDIVPGTGGNIRDSERHWGFRTKSDGDGVSIFGSSHVWIDHLSMANCADGLIDAIQASTAFTISNCHMTRHDHVMLLGANDNTRADSKMQATIAYNHFGQGLMQRMPRCRWGFFHVVNNDYTHWLMYAIGGSARPTIISQGNRYIAPPNPRLKEVTHRAIDEKSTDVDWSKWNWRSEGDLLKNGAFFVQSGRPVKGRRFSTYNLIKAKPAGTVGRLTRHSGTLNCKPNYPC